MALQHQKTAADLLTYLPVLKQKFTDLVGEINQMEQILINSAFEIYEIYLAFRENNNAVSVESTLKMKTLGESDHLQMASMALYYDKITANCNGYLKWSNGEEGKVQIRVKPDKTTIYTAICEGGLGCSAENSIEVIVKTDSPKVKDLALCYGDTLTLRSGCAIGTKAHWTEDWFDIPNRIERIEAEKIKLFETKIYAVSCEGSARYSDAVVIKITVKPQVQKPIIQAEKSIRSDGRIIKVDSLELFANGCDETEWMTDNNLQISVKTSKIIVKPFATTIFSARCKVDGCYSDYSSFKVLVRPRKPNVTVTLDTLVSVV